jgi:dolichol-phosphate mannosyltransferase
LTKPAGTRRTPSTSSAASAVTLSVLVPAYNEERSIAQILEKVLAEPTPKEIVVVDDGSKDRTSQIVETFADRGVRLIRHERNSGKGAAIHTALLHAHGRFVIIQDADLEYEPNDFSAIMAPLLSGEVDVVYGSRNMTRNPRVSKLFYWGGRAVTFVANLLFGSHLTDEATCYKAMRRDLLETLHLRSRGFGFCAEVTGKLLRRGVRIREVPITYAPRGWQEGKKIKMSDGAAAVMILLWYRFFERP